VSYSRDYIRRLAREEKIQATQIDKQWFIDRESLLNFVEINGIEDSVKKRILSLNRKNDLEVKEFYLEKVLGILARQQHSRIFVLGLVTLIMSSGLMSGLILNHGIAVVSQHPHISTGQLLVAIQSLSNEASVVTGEQAPKIIFADTVLEEVTEKIPMDDGIVLFPALAKGTREQVETFFSDEVTVIVTGTSTGFVRSENSELELPFVRIPNTDTTP
jgi:hypothetical protein